MSELAKAAANDKTASKPRPIIRRNAFAFSLHNAPSSAPLAKAKPQVSRRDQIVTGCATAGAAHWP
jgi:hypothetical protein